MIEQYSQALLQKAANIRLLICDVDGVLSDGKVYYSNGGEEIKNFNIKDGLGIKLLQKHGIQVAIITGRASKIVAHRAQELGIQLVFQGNADKRAAFDQILQTLHLEPNQIAHIGDDLPDLALMKKAGLGICVADGHSFVKANADWITPQCGGQGAVRDVADLLLSAQGKLTEILHGYLS